MMMLFYDDVQFNHVAFERMNEQIRLLKSKLYLMCNQTISRFEIEDEMTFIVFHCVDVFTLTRTKTDSYYIDIYTYLSTYDQNIYVEE